MKVIIDRKKFFLTINLFFRYIYFLSKKASYTIIKIAMPIKIKTGNTSQNPIIEDLVKVVARPTKKETASKHPRNVVNFCILFITFFF